MATRADTLMQVLNILLWYDTQMTVQPAHDALLFALPGNLSDDDRVTLDGLGVYVDEWNDRLHLQA